MRRLYRKRAILRRQIGGSHPANSYHDRRLHLEVLEGRLVLAPITGSVFLDSNLNGIRDAGEPGIAGEEVELVFAEINGRIFSFEKILTDSSGSYEFTSIPFDCQFPGIQPCEVRYNGISEGLLETTSTTVNDFSTRPYAVGLRAGWVATGLLDDNSSLDFVVTNKGEGTLTLFLSISTGEFINQEIFVGTDPTQVAIADFNGDGANDLVVAHANLTHVSLLINDGQGGFPTVETLLTGGIGSQSITVADFNEDGHLDIVALNAFSDDLSILLNNGTQIPSFTLQPLLDTGIGNVNVATARLQPGEAPSLILSNSVSSRLEVYSNNGSAQFTLAQAVPLPEVFSGDTPSQIIPSSPINLSVGDIDNDGVDDIAMASANSGIVTIFFGNGTGGLDLNDVQQIFAGSVAGGVTVADFDFDGKLDVVVAVGTFPEVLLNLGGRQLVHPGNPSPDPDGFLSGATVTTVGVGDFNSDGTADFVSVFFDPADPNALFASAVVGLSRTIPGYNLQDFDLSLPLSNLDFGVAIDPSTQDRSNGDFNGDGTVNSFDLSIWQFNYGEITGAGLIADANDSGSVDGADFLIWQRNVLPVVATESADFDANGSVNGLDFLTWQRGFGTLAPNANKASGDADNDFDVDSDDLTVWRNQFGQTAPPVSASLSSQVTFSSADQHWEAENTSQQKVLASPTELTVPTIIYLSMPQISLDVPSGRAFDFVAHRLPFANAKERLYEAMGKQLPLATTLENRLKPGIILDRHDARPELATDEAFASMVEEEIVAELTLDSF